MPSEEIEDFWEDIRIRSPIAEVSTKTTEGQLILAAEKAAFDLKHKFEDLRGVALTPDLLGSIVAEAAKIFMQKWLETLRETDLSGLITIILEGQNLPPADLKGFLRALPETLVDRVASSALPTSTGIQALVALEYHYRHRTNNDLVGDYQIVQESGKIFVRFTSRAHGEFSVSLTDKFDLEDLEDGRPTASTPE